MGKANATLLANLDLIRQIETATGRRTILVWMSVAGADANGIVEPGNAWHYTFADRATERIAYYDWAVRDTGAIEPRDVFPLPGLEITEITIVSIDSDQAARLARSYGGQTYFDRFSNAHIRMAVRYIQGKLVWDLLLQGAPPVGPFCEVPMTIDATTGQLLSRDLSCLNR